MNLGLAALQSSNQLSGKKPCAAQVKVRGVVVIAWVLIAHIIAVVHDEACAWFRKLAHALFNRNTMALKVGRKHQGELNAVCFTKPLDLLMFQHLMRLGANLGAIIA